MVVFASTYRNIQNVVPSLNLPWNNEPYPDHTWISRTFKKIPLIYLECVLIWSAYLCLKESDWRRKGILASDSTSVETDRYAYEVRPAKSKRKFEKIRIKQYLKWHITAAILDHLIILSTRLTSKKTHDSPVLRTMLNRLKKYGVDLAGSIFNGDKGYDGWGEEFILNHYSVYACFQISNREQTPRKVKTGRRLQRYSTHQYIIIEG